MADFSEWQKAIRTAWLADAAFAALLGDGSQFYTGRDEPESPVYPIVKLHIVRKNPSPLDRGRGKNHKPQIQISFFATSQYVAQNIAQYAEENFQIPQSVQEGISTANWFVENLICVDGMDGGPGRMLNDGSIVQEFVTDWQATVKQTS